MSLERARTPRLHGGHPKEGEVALRPIATLPCDTDMTAADLQQHMTTWNWRSDAGCANAMTPPSFAERVTHRAAVPAVL
jgi:hypothetical protein